MGGMAAWLAAAAPELDPATTFVLGLDTLGAGEPMVVSAEGPLWRVRFDPRGPRAGRRRRAACRAGAAAPLSARRLDRPGARAARRAASASMLSLRGNAFNDYHLPTDTPERVDWDSVDRCLAIAEGAAREWDHELAPGELRRALLEERLRALGEVLAWRPATPGPGPPARASRPARAWPPRPSPAWPGRPRAARRPAARWRTPRCRASSSSAGAIRLAKPIRCASWPSIDLAGHDQLLGVAEADDGRQARAAAHVGQQPHAHLHDPGHRVLGHHPEVGGQRQLERAAQARAVDLADRGLGHLLEQVPPGQDRAAEAAQPATGPRDSSRRSLRSMPDENIGPSPRTTTQRTVGVAPRPPRARGRGRRSARR